MSHHARNVVTTAAQKMIPNAFRARSPRVGMIEHPSAAAESTPTGCRNTPDLTCLALSVFSRFISQIVDFIFLFVRFISLFGRVGNLHSNVSQYQCLAGMGRVARPPGIGFSQYFTVDQGNRPGRLAPPPAPSAGTEGRAPRAGLARRDGSRATTTRRAAGQRRTGARQRRRDHRQLRVSVDPLTQAGGALRRPSRPSQAGPAIPSRAPRP